VKASLGRPKGLDPCGLDTSADQLVGQTKMFTSLFEQGPMLINVDASPQRKKKDPELNVPRPTRGSVWQWHWPIDWKEQLPGVLI